MQQGALRDIMYCASQSDELEPPLVATVSHPMSLRRVCLWQHCRKV